MAKTIKQPEKATHQPSKKEIIEVDPILSQFADMVPQDRIDLYNRLAPLIQKDLDSLSQGNDPGNQHYLA